MWLEHLPPGQVTTLTGNMRHATMFGIEVMMEAIEQQSTNILYIDGGHCLNPYEYAEYNLVRDQPADQGGNQVQVIRSMTAYQWHQCLSNELPSKLATTDVDLVIVNPYDALLTHSDLDDWEAEAYTRVTLRDLKATAKLHHIPIVLLTNFPRLWRSHPSIAQQIHENAHHHAQIELIDQAWRLRNGHVILAETQMRQRRITDYIPVVPNIVRSLVPALEQ